MVQSPCRSQMYSFHSLLRQKNARGCQVEGFARNRARADRAPLNSRVYLGDNCRRSPWLMHGFNQNWMREVSPCRHIRRYVNCTLPLNAMTQKVKQSGNVTWHFTGMSPCSSRYRKTYWRFTRCSTADVPATKMSSRQTDMTERWHDTSRPAAETFVRGNHSIPRKCAKKETTYLHLSPATTACHR